MSPVGTGDAELLPQGCLQARDGSAHGNNEGWRAVELVPAGMSIDEQGESEMTMRLKKLKDQVMVITGASSGIGLTTARMAAERGARLVLAARNEEALHQLADEIRRGGGEAIP